jgi:PKHD-type hydroxylase
MDGKEIVQSVGDGALYQGCEVYHWRKPFKGSEYIQVFLHYVDANGPYKDYIHDSCTKPCTDSEISYKYTVSNPNLQQWYKFTEGFTPDECDTIVSMFKNQDLGKAQVGDGAVNESVRKSLVYWIPKVKRYNWIYERILSLSGKANDSFYKFDLTEIMESLQFTVYDESFKGRYDWHVDGGGKELQGMRKLSVVVQLSDPCSYEGGELQFGTSVDEKIEVADKNKGCVVLFPSYMRHRATEVTKGTRYSLVVWISGPPFR